MTENPSYDPQETDEWLDALAAVIERQGVERGHAIIEALIDQARRAGANLPFKATTAYVNTIHVNDEVRSPGDKELEYRIRSFVRWNALATVVCTNAQNHGLGGHISTFASSATLYDVGWNHFFKGPDHPDGADLVYFQGHSSPGVYARAFLEGRLNEADLNLFRQETGAQQGLSSYPHPWLMPDFWQFPTVSMGLGPMMAIYQARFMRYLQSRGLIPRNHARVWAFLGDGEMDEPESLGASSLAAREKLDNLTFMDVPSPNAGVVRELKIKVGDKASEGTLILVLEEDELQTLTPEVDASESAMVHKLGRSAAPLYLVSSSSAPAGHVQSGPVSERAASASSSLVSLSSSVHLPYASPAVRRLARELGVDLSYVSGTARRQRITKEDVRGHVKQALRCLNSGVEVPASILPAAPEIDFSQFGEVSTQSLTKIQPLTGRNLHRSWVTVSHVTQFDDADITEIENPPEVAILGVSRAKITPVYREGAFVPRLICPLSLSYDHRVIDGADAARFTTILRGVLSDIRLLLL